MAILACHHHDSVELVCTFALEVELTLRNGGICTGIARDTKTSADKHEYLLLEIGGILSEVNLLDIASIKAVTDNPYFHFVSFIE